MNRVLFFSILLCFIVLVHATATRAEQVECPNCWRMIDDGPCRCPHCEAVLPGRTCESDRDRSDSEDSSRTTKRRPSAQRPRAESPESPSSGDDEGPPRRPSPTVSQPEDVTSDRENVRDEERGPEDVTSDRENVRDEERGPAPRRRVVRRRRPPPRQVREVIDDEEEPEDQEHDDEEEDTAEEESPDASPDYTRGPHFLIGYRYLGIRDWAGDGHTHDLTIEGFPLARYVPWLRAGLGVDIGFRLSEPHTDWLMRGFITLGVQYPRRITPYGAISIGGGTMYQERFGQGMTYGLFGMNIDAGATFKLTRTFAADLSLGYAYTQFNDLGFHSVTVRIALGW